MGEKTGPRAVPTWDSYFLALAAHAATRSKHPRVQHGAILADCHQRVIATGYNGGPAGFPDGAIDWSPGMTWTSRDWTIHAEENALLQAGQAASRGCTLYVTGPPCPRCLLRAVHCGVCEVVCGAVSYSQAGADLATLRELALLSGVSVWRSDGASRTLLAPGA